ncbi:MAG TPA: tyrosine-type recombinase/integrase [Xanthobacteraceae bacterium]
MSVRRRKWTTRTGEQKESWIVDYADQAGKRHLQTFDRKKEAEAYHDKVRTDVRRGTHFASSTSPTVPEVAASWLKRVEANGRERGTLDTYRQHVRIHILPYFGVTKLAQLNPTKIEAYRDDLLEQLSRPMARKVLSTFRSIMKAAKCTHLTADVSIAASKRSEHKLEVGRDIPTTNEVGRLIKAADGRQRALLLVAALCGLRASELRGLRWADVDLRAGELRVTQRADRYNQIGAPKSVSSRRTLPLAPETISALKTWKLACPKGELGLAFPSIKGVVEHHMVMLKTLAPAMKVAGVVDKDGKPKYGLHAFRHFFASWCINPRSRGGRELPAKVVQALLGHSSIVMTLDIYGHLFPNADDRAELATASYALLA